MKTNRMHMLLLVAMVFTIGLHFVNLPKPSPVYKVNPPPPQPPLTLPTQSKDTATIYKKVGNHWSILRKNLSRITEDPAEERPPEIAAKFKKADSLARQDSVYLSIEWQAAQLK